MAGDDDPPWENEFDDAPTVIDRLPDEAVPQPVQAKDTTGKYKTLPGFSANVGDTSEEVAITFAQGRIYESKKIFTAIRLLRIGAGDHPDAAARTIERLKRWIADNEKLIDAAMKDS